MKNKSNPKKLNDKKFLVAQAALSSQELCFGGITPKPNIGIL
jgi:hypothetical protein